MRKEELRNLKRICATPKMVRMAEENKQTVKYEKIHGWDCSQNKTMGSLYDMFVRCQTRGPYLMVCLFFPGDIAKGEKTPAYEIYCNPEGDEYITRVLRKGNEQRWSRAMVNNLEWVPYLNERYWYKGTEKRIWQNPEGMDTIKSFLGTQEKGIWGLMEWQQNIKRRNTEKKEKREQAPWDADMALVPEIFPSFTGWMAKEAAGEHFIFYQYDRDGAKEGYCTYCERMVPVTGPRHNKEGYCRRCGRKVRYKAVGKAGTIRTRRYTGQVIQRISGGIVIRTFTQDKTYRKGEYRDPGISTCETARTLVMDDGSVKRYTWQLYKNKFMRFLPEPVEWMCDRWSGNLYESMMTKLYTRNFAALRKKGLENSAIDLWESLPVSTERYLSVERKYPVIEKLARIGMFRLAGDLLGNINKLTSFKNNETELAKILGIDRARLKRLRAVNGGIIHLEWYQFEKLSDTIWPDDVIGDFADSRFHTAEFNFLPPPVFSYASPVKIRNYLRKQCAIAGKTMYEMKSTWEDYINMAERAKMDVHNERIWKPKDLTAAHHEVVMILQKGEMEKEAWELEKKWPKVNKNLPRLKKFEYEDKDFAILAPESILDIVREGRALQHCVHTCEFYFDRISRDESYLFFLRRAGHKDIPWYTMEVEPNGNIRQKRTTGDRQNSDLEEAVKFLKKWQKVFVKRMTAEEKKLGEKADQARIAEYAKLRKDGNKIWRGPLAGKLLADVLEADFMAAAF